MNLELRTILLVEDDEDDVFIFNRALKRAGAGRPVQVVSDGRQAISYLEGKDRFSDRARYPSPGLVLLDLKLPIVSGLEVLEWSRGRPELQAVPFIVLSSSSEARDIASARRLGARAFLTKPPSPETLVELLEAWGSGAFDGAGTEAPVISGDRFRGFTNSATGPRD